MLIHSPADGQTGGGQFVIMNKAIMNISPGYLYVDVCFLLSSIITSRTFISYDTHRVNSINIYQTMFQSGCQNQSSLK